MRRGQCHCGFVTFDVETDLSSAFRCNCSFCIRRGATMQKVPVEQWHLKAGEQILTEYGSRDFSKHYFCSRCGIHCFTKITRANENWIAVNVGCLEGVNMEQLSPRLFDGAKLL